METVNQFKLRSIRQVKTYILERLRSLRRAKELGINDRFLDGEMFALEYLHNLITRGAA
jgi:hypothetical protein